MMPPIDVDDPRTWPPPLREAISRWAEKLKSTTDQTSDLTLPLELEELFRALFTGHLVRAYHYTRLLSHERAMILDASLRPLSADLLSDRFEAAMGARVISVDESASFHRAHVLATGEEHNRPGQVCLVLSK